MPAVLPQPGPRTSAAIAALVVVAGLVLSIALVRGMFAWQALRKSVDGPVVVPAAGDRAAPPPAPK